MSCEIEIKAHLDDEEVNSVIDLLMNNPNCENLGKISKQDIYWALNESDKPYFRSRYEITESDCKVLLTSKPLKKKDFNVEYNIENEILIQNNQWDNVLEFCKGLNLHIIRRKYKDGYHFIYHDCLFDIHCEILNVKYLGWFIESEIISDSLDSIDKNKAEESLYRLLHLLRIEDSRVEPRGYNKLLKEVGHENG